MIALLWSGSLLLAFIAGVGATLAIARWLARRRTYTYTWHRPEKSPGTASVEARIRYAEGS